MGNQTPNIISRPERNQKSKGSRYRNQTRGSHSAGYSQHIPLRDSTVEKAIRIGLTK